MFAVLAFGNPLRRDDGAAIEAARELSVELAGLDVLIAHQLLPEHAETVARSQGVVFIDARAGGTPGEVAVESVAAEPGVPTMYHALTPGSLLALAQAAFGAAPAGTVISVAVADLSLGEGLSPEVERAIPGMRQAILSVIAAWRRSDGGCTADAIAHYPPSSA